MSRRRKFGNLINEDDEVGNSSKIKKKNVDKSCNTGFGFLRETPENQHLVRFLHVMETFSSLLKRKHRRAERLTAEKEFVDAVQIYIVSEEEVQKKKCAIGGKLGVVKTETIKKSECKKSELFVRTYY